MRFTLLGALQWDAIRKRLSSFQRQSYIPVILAVQDSKVLQTTQALLVLPEETLKQLSQSLLAHEQVPYYNN